MQAALKHIGAAVLLAFAMGGCSKPKPEGIYLVEGGDRCLQITRDKGGNLIAENGGGDRYWEWRVAEGKNGLRVEVWITEAFGAQFGHGCNESAWVTPSSMTKGDWDLTGVSNVPPRSPDNFTGSAPRRPIEPKPLPFKCFSYLHRVDDPRVMEYFRADPAGKLRLAKDLVRDHADDIAVRFLYWRALYINDAVEPLLEDLALWEERCTYSPMPFVPINFRMAMEFAKAKADAIEGRNGWPYYLAHHRESLTARQTAWSALLKFESIARYPADLSSEESIEAFLPAQTPNKVDCVTAMLELIQGRRAEALDLLIANCYVGQEFSQFGTLITRLIGIAVRAISVQHLAIYAFNACETSEDYEELWGRLRWLEERNRAVSAGDMISLERAMYLIPENYLEANTRRRTTEAKWQNLLAGAAARGRLVTTGMFPQNATEFAPWLGGVPVDPFTSESLKFFSAPEKFTVYSFGPDRDDDLAKVTYDPTNGTASDGDIVLEVPARARYSFPREGLRARTAADVARVFPNGLPPDPFANNRGRGLSVTTDTTPVYIYSFGPDSDERTGPPIRRPEVAYDPTNGVTSDGDLFMTVLPQ